MVFNHIWNKLARVQFTSSCFIARFEFGNLRSHSDKSKMHQTNQQIISICHLSKFFIKTKHYIYIMKHGSATAWLIFHLRFSQSDFVGQFRKHLITFQKHPPCFNPVWVIKIWNEKRCLIKKIEASCLFVPGAVTLCPWSLLNVSKGHFTDVKHEDQFTQLLSRWKKK